MTDYAMLAGRTNRGWNALAYLIAVIIAMALPSLLLGPRVAAWAAESVTVPNVAAVMGPFVWGITICVYLAMAICWIETDGDSASPSTAVRIRRRLVSAALPFVIVGEAWLADMWRYSHPDRTAVLHLTPLSVDWTWVGVAALIAAPCLFSATRLAVSLATDKLTKPPPSALSS